MQKKQCLCRARKGVGQVLFFCAPWSGFLGAVLVRRLFFARSAKASNRGVILGGFRNGYAMAHSTRRQSHRIERFPQVAGDRVVRPVF
jgi:hypothetical protein